MVNYFELYEIPVSFHPDADKVKAKFYELSRTYHPDRYTLASAEEQAHALQLSSHNNEAYKTLKSEYATMAYILKLNGVLEDEEKYNLPPDFLMEMMELNEAISAVEMTDQNESALKSAQQMLEQQLSNWEQAVKPLTNKFDNGDTSLDLLQEIKEQYFRKKYLLRIKERISQ